jgi:hypothetical protein
VKRATLLVVPLLLMASTSRASVDIAWDCYLQTGPVACGALEQAFFSSGLYGRGDPIDASAAHLSIRAAAQAGGVAYAIDVKSPTLTLTLVDRVPSTLQGDAVLLRLVTAAQKATASLFAADAPATVSEGGAFHLALRDPAATLQAATVDEATRWYTAPELSAGASREGVTNVNGRGALEVSWSHPAWRIHGWGWSNYRLVLAEPVAGGGEQDARALRYESFDIGTDWTVARSLVEMDEGLSLAGQGNIEHEPQNNWDLRANTYVGAEWVLVPFLKNDGGNIGAQYVIGAEFQRYVLPNVLNKSEHTFMRHRLSVFGRWHFARVDVEGGATGASVVNDMRFSSVSAFGGATWRILDDLSLSVAGEAAYRHGLINAPKNLAALHPLAQFYGGASYGAVTFETTASIKYVFGNSLLLGQDQRWR